ncbi:MAG TPA: hypothetical protein VF828_00480 [Patescibacteria group bacterium]
MPRINPEIKPIFCQECAAEGNEASGEQYINLSVKNESPSRVALSMYGQDVGRYQILTLCLRHKNDHRKNGEEVMPISDGVKMIRRRLQSDLEVVEPPKPEDRTEVSETAFQQGLRRKVLGGEVEVTDPYKMLRQQLGRR